MRISCQLWYFSMFNGIKGYLLKFEAKSLKGKSLWNILI